MTLAPGDPDEQRASMTAGRVGRPHGLDGSFYVTQPLTRLLRVGAVASVGERTAEIVRLAGTEQRPIVRLDGIGDRDAAQALRGQELRVDRAEAPRLKEGEWWAHELEGCEVHGGGRVLGTVARLIELPSCEALEVRAPGASEPLLVPMVADAVLAVAPEQRRIEVDVAFLGL